MNEKTLKELSDTAIDAVKKAGKHIKSFPRKDVNVEMKGDQETLASQVVTQVDTEVESLIVEHLKDSMAKYNLGLLTEETTDDKSRLEKDFFWCIDPIDGTLSFVENQEGYAVSIALISRDGMPYIGVVYDPVNSSLYHAAKGLGAFKDGKEITISENSELTVYLDRSSTEDERYENLLDHLKQNGLKVEGPKIGYGAVMNALKGIENAPGCYFKLSKESEGGGSFWDFAATCCIYNELGLVCVNEWGEPLNLNKKHTTFMHENSIIYSTNIETAELILGFIQNISDKM
ncbi:3'(2'),5'-bisphosphate nucleotidase CysQ family protein [Mangrovivirga cuniculi]|uniref:Inositol monophosphatase n=1 Tax=Mangrovivirga cuniculi TaxID=2715131 RepID=A0A4D7JLV1_9BACT|nr:inositol monophosphatase family protein [Mangrovivirga cuniculi]QCK14480.1 inositol monophosphatase [Mangrovivirga cuniculi]